VVATQEKAEEVIDNETKADKVAVDKTKEVEKNKEKTYDLLSTGHKKWKQTCLLNLLR